MSASRITSLLTLLSLALIGCAVPAAERRERDLLLSTWQPPAGQRCVTDSVPATLPSLSSLVDSALFSTLVTQFWERTERESGDVLLSIKIGARGRLLRSRVIETSLPDSLARRLEVVVASAIEELPHASPLSIRLAIGVDSAPRFRVGRRQLCAPAREGRTATTGLEVTERAWAERDVDLGPSPSWVLTGGAEPRPVLTGGLAMVIRGEGAGRDSSKRQSSTRDAMDDVAQSAARPEAVLRLLIGPDGRVRSVERIAGTTDVALLERATRWAFRQRYHPALDDRIPAEGLVTISVR